MAINLSDITARGGGGGGGSVSWDFHAIKRDSDGMLEYTKVTGDDNDVIDLITQPKLDSNGDPIFRTLDDYTIDANGNPIIQDPDIDPYYQYKFDSRSLSYFIDDDGFLVARMGQTYDYATNGPK